METEIRAGGRPGEYQPEGISGPENSGRSLRRIRFENRVLGTRAPVLARLKLIGQLNDALASFLHVSKLEDQVAAKSVTEGFGRLDALNRIGNRVFSLDTKLEANYSPESAPVHFRIWDASWFLWVQYDGSIEQPMVRNAGEALGVGTPITLSGQPDQLFRSRVRVDTLNDIEKMLAGQTQPDAQAGFTVERHSGKTPGCATCCHPSMRLCCQGAAAMRAFVRDAICAGRQWPAFWSSDR